MGLDLSELRKANLARVGEFKNKHGGHAHSEPDGSDWSPAQWLQALVGEIGEYANIRKKYERGDLTQLEFEVSASKELADVQTYLDLLAMRALDGPEADRSQRLIHSHGIDLSQATIDKFNEVSHRVGSTVRLV